MLAPAAGLAWAATAAGGRLGAVTAGEQLNDFTTLR